jgi:phage-related minor tail protein
MTTGQLQVQLTADTAQYQAGITQAATITAQQMRQIASYVKAANDAQAQLGRSAQQAATQARTGFDAVSKGAEGAAHSSNAVTRELIVLAHEMSQGNYSRFGGSMLVLAERINFMKFAASAAGVATIGLGVAVLGTVALIAKGAIDANRFANALQLTGNYAAVSQQQIEGLAASQAKLTNRTEGSARDTLQAVAGSGLFSPQIFAQIARAMGDYQKVSGATADEALKDFARMRDGVTRWAAEQNQSMHFLTLAQYEHIKALEDAGHADEAAAVAVGALSAALEGRATPAVGYFARAWQAVKDAASSAAQAIENIGRPADKVAEQIANIDKQIQLVKQANTANPGEAADTLAALQEQRRQLQAIQAQAAGDRAAKAQADSLQLAAIKAKDYTDAVLTSAKALSTRNQELAKWDAAVKAQAAAGKPMSAEDITAGRAEIIKRFTPTDITKQSDEYTNLIATIKAFNDTTNQESIGLAKLSDGQKFVIQVQEQLTKSGKALTDQQRSHLLDLAQSAAAARDAASAEIALQTARTHAAAKQADFGIDQDNGVQAVAKAASDQMTALYRQTQLVGKATQDIFSVQELQKFDDAVGQALLGKDDEGVRRILDTAAAVRGPLLDSINQARAAQDKWNSSFENGFGAAFHEYAQQATNSAQAGAQVFNDGVRDMSDSIVEFARTGTLSFHKLIDDMIADLIRLQEQKAFTSLFGGAGAANGGGLFDSAAGAAAASAADFFPTFANGLDYVPYDGFPAVLHEGERVLTKQDAATDRGGRGAMHVDNSVRIGSIGAGVSRAEVHAAVAQAQAQGEARMRRLLRNGSVVTS